MYSDEIRTVGVEEEFLLVHCGSPLLASVGDEVVATAGRLAEGQFEHEFKQEQAETGTAPHHAIADVARDLRSRRRTLAEAASRHGVRLLASATSPLDQDSTTTIDRRYARMGEVFGQLARAQLTCGMHVHVAIASREEGVAVLDRIRGWLPVLTALSANSPYVAGQDTGYASYRSILWAMWPSAGATEPFGTAETYERATADLVATGAALDDGMIYFDARLSASYPTVEVRVCDVCADVADGPVLAALTRALVATAARHAVVGFPAPCLRGELLAAARWRAARWGLEDQLVDPVERRLVPAGDLVDRLLDLVALELARAGDDTLVADGIARISRRGTGARLQREAYDAGGITAVVEAVAKRTVS
ncbi:MAG TPA: glutamate--cysteine ligase [Nocardioides sp.]|nr:glutamate--cysteine ligase [Nocardioides sp.]